MTYYKACRTDMYQRFFSLCRFNPDIYVEYKLGEFVYPQLKESKLFCTESIDVAKAYCSEEGDVLFECEVINPIKLYGLNVSIVEDKDTYISYWKDKVYERKIDDIEFLARRCQLLTYQTILCDAVKLTKQISNS